MRTFVANFDRAVAPASWLDDAGPPGTMAGVVGRHRYLRPLRALGLVVDVLADPEEHLLHVEAGRVDMVEERRRERAVTASRAVGRRRHVLGGVGEDEPLPVLDLRGSAGQSIRKLAPNSSSFIRAKSYRG